MKKFVALGYKQEIQVDIEYILYRDMKYTENQFSVIKDERSIEESVERSTEQLAAITELLINKGLITEQEFLECMNFQHDYKVKEDE